MHLGGKLPLAISQPCVGLPVLPRVHRVWAVGASRVADLSGLNNLTVFGKMASKIRNDFKPTNWRRHCRCPELFACEPACDQTWELLATKI